MTLPFTGFVVPSGGSSSGGSGDVVGPASATDNAIARYDTTTGELLQDSALTVSDVAGGVVTLATTAGNALTIDVTEPAATTGASVAGDPAIIQAGDAVASTDTAGAAAGGDITVRAGNAARFTSGNAAGGNVILDTGTGIGTGASGLVKVFGTAAADAALYRMSDLGGSYTGLGVKGGDGAAFEHVWGLGFHQAGEGTTLNATGVLLRRGTTVLGSTAGVHGANPTSYETGLYSAAAGVWSAIKSSVSVPAPILQAVLVEASTAGSGAPNALTAAESFTVLTNEGTTAANYHALPTAVAGYVFEFIVQDADGIRIVANTSDTIRVIDKVTAAAGYIESTTIGSTVRLVSINAVEWFATSIHGVWTDGTFTFDDTGSTSP